jgi:glycosyltransferase involved in cell wall biosynthesis
VRILALENEMSSRRGGQERSLLAICEGLAARGHAIVLAYVRAGDFEDRYRRCCEQLIKVHGYTVDRSRTAASLLDGVGSVLALRTAQADVVYANQYLDSPLARVSASLSRRPFVCHLRLPPPDSFSFQYRYGMRGAVRLIANSRQTRDDYVAHGFRQDRIDVVYNGIDASGCSPARGSGEVRQALGVPPSSFLIAFAGRLHPGKGIDTLVDAVSRLASPVDLVIAGREHEDGSGRAFEVEVRKAIRDRGVESRCHLVGHVDPIADVFAAADVTVLPSVVSETFGRAIVESMACGTPVIASRIGGIPEVMTGEFDGHLVLPGDAPALAAKLEQFRAWRTNDPGLGARGRAHVERHFALTSSVDGVEAVLRRVLDEWHAGTAVRAATAAVW